MEFETGVDPMTIEEEAGDISKAKAGSKLFKSNEKTVHKVSTKTLFNNVNHKPVHAREDEQIFESKIEVANTEVQSTKDSNSFDVSIILMALCVILIVTYIFSLLQRRRMKKEMEGSKKEVRKFLSTRRQR